MITLFCLSVPMMEEGASPLHCPCTWCCRTLFHADVGSPELMLRLIGLEAPKDSDAALLLGLPCELQRPFKEPLGVLVGFIFSVPLQFDVWLSCGFGLLSVFLYRNVNEPKIIKTAL